MRTVFLLVLSALAIGACSDEQPQPTSPMLRTRAEGQIAGATETSTAGTAVSQAKPVDQVGFTKVIQLSSPPIHVKANWGAQSYVDCPLGSKATGGGYYIDGFGTPGARPWVKYSRAANETNGQQSWEVQVVNDSATEFDFTIYVECAS